MTNNQDTPLPSEATIPSGVRDNELIVFEAFISKYLCANDKFDRVDFLNSLIENRFGTTDAFFKEEKLKALDELNHDYNKLILRTLNRLAYLGLLKKNIPNNGYEAEPSLTLKLLCPTIQRYLMPVIEDLIKSILDLEMEIRTNQHSLSILEFLNILETRGELNRSEVSLESDELDALAQRGVIEISLTNQVTLSYLGNILNQRRREIR